MEHQYFNTQKAALRLMFNLDKEMEYETLLALLGLETMRERAERLTLNFEIKLKKNKEKVSIAKTVWEAIKRNKQDNYDIMMGGRQMLNNGTYSTPFKYRIKKLTKKYGIQHLVEAADEAKKGYTEKMIRWAIKENARKRTLKKWEKQRRPGGHGKIRYEWRVQMPEKGATESPLERVLKETAKLDIRDNSAYIPSRPNDWKTTRIEAMGQLDNNPKWFKTRTCPHCKNQTKRQKYHELMECRKFSEQRKEIINSLLQELEILSGDNKAKTNWLQTLKENEDEGRPQILANELHEALTDLTEEGWISNLEISKEIITRILTGYNNAKIQEFKIHRIRAMMRSHFHLLCTMITETIEPEKWVKIQEEPLIGWIAEDDIFKGKIICRTKIRAGSSIILKNIRDWMRTLSIQKATKYNLGFGAASERTWVQKAIAKQYAEKVIAKAKKDGTIIYVDGSIHDMHSEERTKAQQRGETGESIEREKHGGYGILLPLKNKDHVYNGRVQTNDAQLAEITGITKALDIIEEIQQEEGITQKTYSIICDCKNAVNYSTGTYITPREYAMPIQKIKRKRANLIRKEIDIKIKWIPGHSGERGNEIVDGLAKYAARSWDNSTYGHSKQREAKAQIDSYSLHNGAELLGDNIHEFDVITGSELCNI